MKLGGRAPEDEDLPVVLVDDRGVPPTITTAAVELGRPRRRLRELLLVVAAVAVVAGVGLVGGDGGADPREAATPSTTERRTAARESIEDWRATSSTTRPRPRPTTTTSAVELFVGDGPMLPSLTGTTLGILDHSGGVTILDVDTGDRCRTIPSRNGSWVPWSTGIDLPSVIVQANTGLVSVDRGCNVASLGDDTSMGWPAAVTGSSLWMVDGNDQSRLVEHTLVDGLATGRVIEVPTYVGVQAVGEGDHLVLGVTGSMTYVDLAAGGTRRDLGPGVPVGLRDGLLLYSACPALQCHVATLDLATGGRQIVEATGDVTPWDTSAFSADGRYARVSIANETGEPTATVIDLVARRVVLRTELTAGVFSRDGRWLIGLQRGDVVALALDGSNTVPIELEMGRAIQSIVSITNP